MTTYINSEYFPETKATFESICNIINSFNMPLFFMIAGFVYYKAYFKKKFVNRMRIKHQVLNLLGEYLIFSLGYGTIKLLFRKFVNNPISIKDIVLICIKPIDEYWFLYVLVMLYIFYLIPGIEKKSSSILLCLTFLLNLISIFASDLFELHLFCYYLFFFTLGLVIAREGRNLYHPSVTLCLTLFSIIVISIFEREEKTINSIPLVSTISAIGICLGLLFLFRSSKCIGDNELLRYFGKHSLEIYLIHGFIESIVRVVLIHFVANSYISVVVNFIISISVPLMIAYVCRRVGIYDLIFKPGDFVCKCKAILC